MQIRVGYELIYDCPQPTPMICMLNVHHSRVADLVVPDHLVTDPPAAHHALSRRVRQLVQPDRGPAGRDALASEAVVDDPAGPTRSSLGAGSTRSQDLPEDSAGVPARQPLLRDRPAVRRRLAPVRQDAAWLGAGAGDLRLRPPPHRLRLRARPRDQDRAGGLQRAARRVPRLRPSRDRLLPLPEHPGALLHRLSRRHRRAAAVRARWISPAGSRPISAAPGTRSTRATTCRASAGS